MAVIPAVKAIAASTTGPLSHRTAEYNNSITPLGNSIGALGSGSGNGTSSHSPQSISFDGTTIFFIVIAFAVIVGLICAGCIGCSFEDVDKKIAKRKRQRDEAEAIRLRKLAALKPKPKRKFEFLPEEGDIDEVWRVETEDMGTCLVV